MQAASDENATNAKNVVTYRENSIEGIGFNNLDGTLFKNYNFALTAGYAITDRNGLGYYGSYSQQSIQSYYKSKIRPNTLDPEFSEDYFVMTSAFAQTPDYSDTNKATNLVIDKLVDQSLIGSSYSPADDKDKAKTIVKVFKEVTDSSGNLSTSKVFMDSSADSNSDYHDNYLKWTGQKSFDIGDVGKYYVQYYWSLSDGRYLTDKKTVNIESNLSEVEKTVNAPYVEKNDNASIDYTVTYTNRTEGNFTICDILPFEKDIRFDDTQEGHTNKSVMQKSSFTLTGIEVSSETKNKDDANPVSVAYKSYFSTSGDVKAYIKNGDKQPADDAAAKVNVSDGNWTEITDSTGIVDNITALAVTGTQTNAGTCTVTIKYTVKVNNADIYDFYVNNAFFKTEDKVSSEEGFDGYTVNGFSNSVTTAVVGSGLSGYVWYDKNLNGRFDKDEPPIQGVTVKLVDKNGTDTGFNMTTDKEGYYCFESVPAGGNYEVRFLKNVENVEIEGKQVGFDDLTISRTLSKSRVTEKFNSRNIAQKIDGVNEYYIDEPMPTPENIFKNNSQLDYYEFGSVTNYYFERQFQNLGLRDNIPEKYCSLTINKVDAGTNEKLKGVKFKLEYIPEGQNDYIPVKYKMSDDGQSYEFAKTGEGLTEAVEVSTDADGQIKFTKLPPFAQYRLTEVATVKGYNILTTPLEFTLPYFIADGKTDGYVSGNDENPEKGTYYYDVTYTVTNSKIPNMPLTGVENNILPIVIASVLFAMCLAMIIIFRIVKKREKAVK